MKYEDLLAKYEAVILENALLKEENKRLKAQLGIGEKYAMATQESNEIQAPLEIQEPNKGNTSVEKSIPFRPLSPVEKVSLAEIGENRREQIKLAAKYRNN